MASVKNLTVLTMQQIIPTFERASAAIAAQLIRGTLSDRELDSVRNTLFGLQASLHVWKKKHGTHDRLCALKTNRSPRRVISKHIPSNKTAVSIRVS